MNSSDTIKVELVSNNYKIHKTNETIIVNVQKDKPAKVDDVM
jgi:hypothetical protein